MAAKKSKTKKSSVKAKAKTKAKIKAKAKPARKKPVRKKKPVRSGGSSSAGVEARIHQGVGLKTVPKSSDAEGLSDVEDVDSESVAELADEGQDYEAEVISGIENAGAANQGEVRTREVPEDDVPEEYRDSRESDV
jgi:hypothetical protein